jgi:hypothetical protein
MTVWAFDRLQECGNLSDFDRREARPQVRDRHLKFHGDRDNLEKFARYGGHRVLVGDQMVITVNPGPMLAGDVNLNWPRRDGCSWPHLSGGE